MKSSKRIMGGKSSSQDCCRKNPEIGDVSLINRKHCSKRVAT